MKKFFTSVVLGFLFLAASAFAQEQKGAADIEQFIHEQKAQLATVSLELLHMDITHAADRMLRAFAAYSRIKEKVANLSNHERICVQLPAIPHGKILGEVRVSVEQVVNLVGRAAPLLKTGGVPSEGMKKLLEGDLPQLMRTIAEDGAKLQSLFSDLETSCAKEG